MPLCWVSDVEPGLRRLRTAKVFRYVDANGRAIRDAAVIRRIQEFALTEGQAARIDTPLLITSPEGEQFWPGQSERLAGMTPNVSHLARFTAAEGAEGHCEPLARTLVHERVLDWVSATIPD